MECQRVNYEQYLTGFLRHRAIAEVREVAHLEEGGRVYPLLVARTEGRRSLLVTAGFHGDETAGPLTLLEHLPDVVAYARERGVGLTIYPCLNPSGFSDRTRYNRSGESPNNDFLRYQLEDGAWVDELRPGQRFSRFEVHRAGPKETRALAAELESLPTPHAALDIHQDPWLEGRLSYGYTFGVRDAYLPLVDGMGMVVPVARHTQVDEDVHTDAHGLIEHHDGSVTDWMYRRGVPFTAALETTTRTPMSACHQVNLLWIRGFVDLAARA